MDNGNELIEIYKKLPETRAEVLNLLLVGYSTEYIAYKLFRSNKNPINSVQGHFSEIYDDYSDYLKNADPASKRIHLIILFYTYAPAFVASLRIKFGSPVNLKNQVQQFGCLPNEHEFELHRVSKEEIPVLQVLGQKYFGAQDHLPTELLEGWLKRDGNSFRKIQNKNGRIVGFFIILFIKPEIFKAFSNGIIFEKDLKNYRITSLDELAPNKEVKCYISVVVGEDGHAVTNVSILLLLAKYLDELGKYRKIDKLYGMAATDNGKKLMEGTFNFNIYKHAQDRIDKENFYELNISHLNIGLFEYLKNNITACKKCASNNVDFSNEDDWKPIYHV